MNTIWHDTRHIDMCSHFSRSELDQEKKKDWSGPAGSTKKRVNCPGDQSSTPKKTELHAFFWGQSMLFLWVQKACFFFWSRKSMLLELEKS